jgi:hypothetical protein
MSKELPDDETLRLASRNSSPPAELIVEGQVELADKRIVYSFTEPRVRPETRYLLSARKTTTTGMLTRIEAAA